jgi:hypothetical protein
VGGGKEAGQGPFGISFAHACSELADGLLHAGRPEFLIVAGLEFGKALE